MEEPIPGQMTLEECIAEAERYESDDYESLGANCDGFFPEDEAA